jgi:hypothetical protein
MRRRLRVTRSPRVALVAGALALLALAVSAAPAGADVGPVPTPSLPDVNPFDDLLPSVGDLAGKLIEGIFKALFGNLEAKVTLGLVKFLVAHPIVTNHAAYGTLNEYRVYVTDGAWGLLALVLVISSFRYWASGFAGGGAYEALQGLVRTGIAAALLVAFPFVFEQLLVAGNLLTHALLAYSGIEKGLAKLFVASKLVLGLGGIAYVLELVAFIALIVTKIVLTALLSVLLVSSPLAIALWPIDELSWLARTWFQTFIAVVLWPVIWALCFAAFAAMGDAAFSTGGSIGDTIIKPFVSVAMLYIAFKVPVAVLRQAQLAGVTPNVGRAGMRGAQAGMMASRMGAASAGAGGAASGATTAAEALAVA